MSCKYCDREDNDFVLINETAGYSDIEMSLNRQGMIRVRVYNGDGWTWVSQDIVNIAFCPMCGRKLAKEK